MASRDYWIHFSVELADNADIRNAGEKVTEHGLGNGSRISFQNYDGTWMSDEHIDKMVQQHSKFYARYLKDMRNVEIERARREAEPFWRRWLGA